VIHPASTLPKYPFKGMCTEETPVLYFRVLQHRTLQGQVRHRRCQRHSSKANAPRAKLLQNDRYRTEAEFPICSTSPPLVAPSCDAEIERAFAASASMLQRAGLIQYRYGKLTILDPEGLAKGACECYEIMERQFEGIFDQPWLERADQQERGVEAE